jgi:ribulose-phosphate 3-epimerase
MDGVFVPPITFGASMVRVAAEFPSLFVDTHLMVSSPESHIQPCIEAGSHRIIIHQEASPHVHRLIGMIRSLGASPGVAINPGTPVSLVEDLLPFVDLVLVMTVNPGWGGQPFLPHCLKKIECLHSIIARDKLSCTIEVDGGIGKETGAQCIAAGAGVLVAGSSIFGHGNNGGRFLELSSALNL